MVLFTLKFGVEKLNLVISFLLKLHCLYVFFNYGVEIKSWRCLRALGLLFGYWREVFAQVKDNMLNCIRNA